MTERKQRIPLGELLAKEGLITQEQLTQAIAKHQITGERVGVTLISMGFIDETTLLTFLAKQLQIPLISLKSYPLNFEFARKLPEMTARRFRMILLGEEENNFLLGMVDPQDIFALDEAERILKKPIRIALIREKECLEMLDLIYRRTEEITKFAKELAGAYQESEFDLDQLDREISQDDAPVAKLLRSIFEDAVQISASDVHIEPGENSLSIRLRVDGTLQEHHVKDSRVAAMLTQRLKILAKLNIMEKRLPQDGRFSLKVKNKNFDIRLSTMPIQFGESVVMRLLPHNLDIVRIDNLEMSDQNVQTVKELLQSPHGMILITGPTGSGKTTTLFSILNELNSPENKIITIEDPIEYHLPRLNQVQVNPLIELTFARVLRSALRQDPDIIMVGEVRDQETLTIALRSAMTGHLVLASMHTNDSISAIMRMIELESEQFLIASALRLVISQRLVKRMCANCAEDYTPNAMEKLWLDKVGYQGEMHFKKGKGCTLCNGTGYHGRFAIFEMLRINSQMADALRSQNLTEFNQLASKTFTPLWHSALDAALAFKTTLSEVVYLAILPD